jgi:hypothetical protein
MNPTLGSHMRDSSARPRAGLPPAGFFFGKGGRSAFPDALPQNTRWDKKRFTKRMGFAGCVLGSYRYPSGQILTDQ